MKRISLLALALSTTATMAVSEDFFEGGILWTTFAPQPKNELGIANNREIYRSFESTLNDQNNDITGDDRDRVNSIMPLLIFEDYYEWRRASPDIAWTKDQAMDFLVGKPYGALFGGSYKYESKLTYSLSYEQTKKNRADFEEPISVFSHVGKINKLPLPYAEVPNKITAKGVFVSDDNKRVRLEIRSKESAEEIKCELTVLINNVVYPLKNGEDETFAMVEMNQGRNTFNITKQCFDTNNMISSAPYTRFTDNDTGYNKGFFPYSSALRKRRISISGFDFRIIDPETEKQFTQIKNKIKIKKDNLVDLHYSEDLQLDPELWGWEGHHYTRFIGADDVHQDGGILPTKQRIDLTNLEMIDKKMQKFELLQGENGLKKMFKGTYYPKTTGVYEILVAKSSNISIDIDYYAPWVSTRFNTKEYHSTNSGNAYLYPVYALAMDFSRPVAHSIFRDRGVAPKPIEYDWFWFEVDEDDVKYGMDMSIFALGNVGNCWGKDKNDSGPKKLRIAGECSTDNRAKRYIYDPGTKEDIERSAAKQIGLLASQKLGFYIKPSNSEKFRAFQQSDFVKLDGSTSKHGHDIDGSSEGRINGLNKLDRSVDQPLKDDMELLGGFD